MESAAPDPTASAISPAIVDRNLERLETLQGTDEGVFVLAVHAFVEGWIRDRFGHGEVDTTFPSLLQEFIDHCKTNLGGWIPRLGSFTTMNLAHHGTNGVRHRFMALTRQDAEVATSHLEMFCKLARIGKPERLDSIRRYLAAWDERKPLGATIEALAALKEINKRDAEDKRRLMEQVSELSQVRSEAEHLGELIKQKDRRIGELEKTAEARGEKADAERRERAATAARLKDVEKKLAELGDASAYIEMNRKASVFARTRADYERAIIRLSPEQRAVLSQIKLDADFLVKGAAGTGKTLVLLKAIEKAKSGGEEASLDFQELSGSVALLTYTRTLVKYDAYVARVLSDRNGADRISTADAFIQDRLASIEPGARMDYDVLEELCKRYAFEGFGYKDLFHEAEDFIWGNDVSCDEYVTRVMERRGMKKPLARELRERVWAACEAMATEMESERRFSKGYSRIKLLRAVASMPDDPRIKCMDYIFVDEVQDLTAADLKAIKACARRCVVMAGDADQSIFQPGFSFARAGLDILGRARILKTNFRNTVALHELSERYRALIPGQDAANQPMAYREGPPPELYQAKDNRGLLDLLVARVEFFARDLEYDPGNICVLFSYNKDFDAIEERLSAAGFGVSDIRKSDHAFEEFGRVRLSTFQSSKGLDFPVVLLFLNRPPFVGDGYEDAAAERMRRSSIYVGMTRAMDHLDVLAYEEASSPAIADLVGLFSDEGQDR